MSSIEKLRREYDAHRAMFENCAFTWDVVEAVGEKALLNIWDMFVIFTEVKKINPGGSYLEIGSHLGGSLCCAVQAGGPAITYSQVDPVVAGRKYAIEIEKKLSANIEALGVNVNRKEQYSQVAAQTLIGEFDLIFVDGDHTYSAVKRDFLLYWQKVKVGGALLAHDFSYGEDHEGVVRAVMDTFSFQVVVKPFRSNIAVIRKQPGNEKLFVYGPRYGIEETS